MNKISDHRSAVTIPFGIIRNYKSYIIEYPPPLPPLLVMNHHQFLKLFSSLYIFTKTRRTTAISFKK